MRGFDRDLIRGKHYGPRSCEPHLKGRTHGCTDQVCYAKILLANPEPSTHGTKPQSGHRDRAEPCPLSGVKRTSNKLPKMSAFDPADVREGYSRKSPALDRANLI